MTDEPADPSDNLFAGIGRYVIIFQWLEGLTDQCLLLLWGQAEGQEGQDHLAQMTNQQKVDALLQAFHASELNSRARTRPEWVKSFEYLIERLHVARRRRNELLHSQYLFEFVELGQPVVRSNRRRRNGQVRFETEELGDTKVAALLKNLSELALDLNHAKVQLIHDISSLAIYLDHDKRS